MGQGGLTVKIFCPNCGQKLSVPTTDLGFQAECPRCHAVRPASELVPAHKTVPVIIEYDRRPGAMAAPYYAQQSAPLPLEVAPESLPPDTDPMPGAPQLAPPQAIAGAQAYVYADAARSPGLATRAGQGVAVGAAAAGRFASAMLRAAATVDSWLSGKRPWAVGLAAVLVLVAAQVDAAPGSSGLFSAFALTWFVGTLAVLVLARLDAFRDERGFQARLVKRTFAEFGSHLGDWGQRVLDAPWGQKEMDVAKLLLFGGLMVAAFSSVASVLTLAPDVVSALSTGGSAALGVGAVLFGDGWWRLRRLARVRGLAVDAETAPIVAQALQELPAILDCRTPDAGRAAAERVTHPLLRALLLELSKPWKRAHYDDERECKDRLEQRLLASLPEANPRTERYIGERQRADLLLGDEQAGVLVELKAHAEVPSAFDRLVGQARKYLHLWKGRGPMIIVLCRTNPAGIASSLQREIESMRRDGYAVVAVFAMP